MGAGFARYGFASTCFLANRSEEYDGSEAFAAAVRRAVPSAAGRAAQHEAPTGQAGRADRLGRDRAHLRGVVHLRSWPSSLGSAPGGWAAVPAAHLRCLRRSRGQHLGGEPVLAALLWRDLPADRVAHRPVQLDALE
jgi:hypothetical protein